MKLSVVEFQVLCHVTDEQQIDALNEADICGGYRFLMKQDSLPRAEDEERMSHYGLYPLHVVPDTGYHHSDWLYIELSVLYRAQDAYADHDPFDDIHVYSPAMNRDRLDVLQDMCSRVKRVLYVQQRRAFFFLLVLGDDARLVRFDIAGITATKRFNYKANPDNLTDLLSRFSCATADERGHDTSAHLIDPKGEIGKMMRGLGLRFPGESVALGYFHASLDVSWSWWRLEIYDEVSSEIKPFAVGKPHYCSVDVFAHATRGYIALDLTTGHLVYLKDSWRPTGGMGSSVKEGAVLKILNEHHVPNIPTALCQGDLPGQVSTSQDVAASSEVAHLGRTTSYVHYRFAMKEVGKPVDEFENGFQLISIIRDCVEGEYSALNYLTLR